MWAFLFINFFNLGCCINNEFTNLIDCDLNYILKNFNKNSKMNISKQSFKNIFKS